MIHPLWTRRSLAKILKSYNNSYILRVKCRPFHLPTTSTTSSPFNVITLLNRRLPFFCFLSSVSRSFSLSFLFYVLLVSPALTMLSPFTVKDAQIYQVSSVWCLFYSLRCRAQHPCCCYGCYTQICQVSSDWRLSYSPRCRARHLCWSTPRDGLAIANEVEWLINFTTATLWPRRRVQIVFHTRLAARLSRRGQKPRSVRQWALEGVRGDCSNNVSSPSNRNNAFLLTLGPLLAAASLQSGLES